MTTHVSRTSARDLHHEKRLVRLIRRLPDRSVLWIGNEIRFVRRLDYDKSELVLSVESEIELDTRLHSCSHEPETVRWIEHFSPGSVFYDIGANVGAYSLLAAVVRGSQVFAFEPGASNYDALTKNIQLNKLGDQVTVLPLALGNATGLASFHYSQFTSGASLHALGEAIDFKGERFTPQHSQMLPGFRLDDLVQLLRLPTPNYIKLDVDGIELQVLEGCREVLAHPELLSVLVEVNIDRGDAGDIKEMLEFCGLRFQEAYVHEEAGGAFASSQNWIFAR